MTTITQLIAQIETRQPVLNKDALNEQQCLTDLAGVGSLSDADDTQLSFLADPRYVDKLGQTKAGCVLVTERYQAAVPASSIALVVPTPYLAYASASQLFAPSENSAYIHPTAVIDERAVIGEAVSIGAYCVIGKDVVLGARSHLSAHVVIEAGAQVGEDAVIKSHVVIGHDCVLGQHVRIHAGASIGAEGFGFAPTADPSTRGWERIAQLGKVIIGDYVRIGSNTCIDRGAINDTVLGSHVIVDNLVQIAHNVRIGDGTAIAAKTGIAGSTSIGKRCIIGGAVGINGHISITDDVTISAMSMVTKSIQRSGSYSSGTVAMPSNEWRRAAVAFRKLGQSTRTD
ncbi:UDP-3-O-(3-hydroxymyristoyl)glucosamine N-acyltransferase [Psychrobacter aestuarii]|uniref:UDP-3-O-acylglucosamine N-acyltransferase n=1 Tax=Psychrobacter aestuarii TaxID=556327 RepID=A0ABP3FMI8_9GAMM|nr:UDP-3-O-(3-hydroxymyristoyl)glucosamine N-acyltransferase [Psychrobacter aestuarii]